MIESVRLKTPFTYETCSERDGPPATDRFRSGIGEGTRSVPESPGPVNEYVR